MLKYFTSGESHGEALVAFLSGLPSGLETPLDFVNRELWRRQQGYGRGGRMQVYQLEILLAAMRQVAPAGQLIYSSCSLEPEENEAVVEQALRERRHFRLLDIRDRLIELEKEGTLVCRPDSLLRGPYLRTIPGVHPCDGFFAGLLEREM